MRLLEQVSKPLRKLTPIWLKAIKKAKTLKELTKTTKEGCFVFRYGKTLDNYSYCLVGEQRREWGYDNEESKNFCKNCTQNANEIYNMACENDVLGFHTAVMEQITHFKEEH